jgi:hypothetical protein
MSVATSSAGFDPRRHNVRDVRGPELGLDRHRFRATAGDLAAIPTVGIPTSRLEPSRHRVTTPHRNSFGAAAPAGAAKPWASRPCVRARSAGLNAALLQVEARYAHSKRAELCGTVRQGQPARSVKNCVSRETSLDSDNTRPVVTSSGFGLKNGLCGTCAAMSSFAPARPLHTGQQKGANDDSK